MNGKLPRKCLVLWQIRLLVVFFCAVLALALFLRPFTAAACAAALALLYIPVGVLYLPALFKSLCHCKENQGITLMYGVFRLRKKHCRFNSRPIIFAVSSPIARIMGLEAALIRTTYGFILLPEREIGRWREYV